MRQDRDFLAKGRGALSKGVYGAFVRGGVGAKILEFVASPADRAEDSGGPVIAMRGQLAKALGQAR